MEAIITALTGLFKAATAMTPIAIIALLIGVIYIQIVKQPSKQELNLVKDNHLHELPEIAETLRRMEMSQTQHFATIIAKLDQKK